MVSWLMCASMAGWLAGWLAGGGMVSAIMFTTGNN